MGRACSTHGEVRNAHRILVESLKGRDYPEKIGEDERVE
jgi:hypothetical protein